MPSGSSARPLSARISVSSAVLSHTDAGTVPSCCFHRFSDVDSTMAARGYHTRQGSDTRQGVRHRTSRDKRCLTPETGVGVKSSFRGGADMKRTVLLGLLLAAGAASMAAQTPAAPKVVDILKLKDTLYVLTSSTPGNAATFSGGNVAVFITDGGVT